MNNTFLILYKDYFSIEDDGEAVLDAAEMGYFSLGHPMNKFSLDNSIPNKPLQYSTVSIFDQLGIQPEMAKDKIVECLKGHLQGSSKALEAIIWNEMKRIRKDVTELLKSDNPPQKAGKNLSIRKIARERIEAIIKSAISFCEDDMEQ